MHSSKLLPVSFLTILLTVSVIGGPLAFAQSSFTVLRASFDMVITEVAGENYVMIDNYDPYSYLKNRPINWTYRGSLTGKLGEEVTRRGNAFLELRRMLEEHLPEVEASLELKYWACLDGFDEDPPAIYVGLYKLTEKQMSTIMHILGEAARAEGFVIKFYEAYGHIGLRPELEEAERKLIAAIKNGTVDLPICGLSSYNIAGWLTIYIEYGRIIDHIDKNFVVDIVKAVRTIVGYQMPILFNFVEEAPQPEPLPPSSAETSPNIAYIIALTTIPVVAIIVSTLKRKRKIP